MNGSISRRCHLALLKHIFHVADENGVISAGPLSYITDHIMTLLKHPNACVLECVALGNPLSIIQHTLN